MNKKNKKTKKQTEPHPGDFASQAEAQEAAEEYIKNKPIYTILQFFIGDCSVDRIRNNVEGKPPTY